MLTFETGRTHFEQPLTRLRTPAQLPFFTLSKRFRCRSGRGCRQLKMDTFRTFFHTGGSGTFWTIGSAGIMDDILCRAALQRVLQRGQAADIR